ncbi:leucine-rich repeat domain-containing protein, partial [Neochlamydia sp. TUME1]|uniref:leucine-rich repeat domain-containing protein n=1 Tax=Neochlamydia sp. TUME1 TaxID=1478174 RepID=UPI0034D2A721
LAKSFSALEFKVQIEEKRDLTLANYSSYLLNINRLLLWKKLTGGEKYLSREEIKHLPLEKKGELFRDWIGENCDKIPALNLSLDLSRIGLTYLPPEIFQLSQLQALDLSQNQLTALPIEIGQLSQLQWLNLSQNQLTSLPAEIGQLSQLAWLYLSQNQLVSLPAEIEQLSQLQTLELTENPLKNIAEKIRQRFQL